MLLFKTLSVILNFSLYKIDRCLFKVKLIIIHFLDPSFKTWPTANWTLRARPTITTVDWCSTWRATSRTSRRRGPAASPSSASSTTWSSWDRSIVARRMHPSLTGSGTFRWKRVNVRLQICTTCNNSSSNRNNSKTSPTRGEPIFRYYKFTEKIEVKDKNSLSSSCLFWKLCEL